MAIDKFDADVTTWGSLVKSWATNLNYVDTAFPNQPPAGSATGKPWALPTMAPATVTAEGGGTVPLPKALAMTAAQFTNRLTKANIPTFHLPTQYAYVIVVQGDAKTMIVKLPPEDVLKASEADILGNGYAPPHNFYQTLYTKPGTPPIGPFMPTGVGPLMQLHARRIGDYTMSNCD